MCPQRSVFRDETYKPMLLELCCILLSGRKLAEIFHNLGSRKPGQSVGQHSLQKLDINLCRDKLEGRVQVLEGGG